jgi:2-haloacid dehalogenase
VPEKEVPQNKVVSPRYAVDLVIPTGFSREESAVLSESRKQKADQNVSLNSFGFLHSMVDLTQLKVITFDCYGTMIDWESGIFSALRPILAAHGKSLTDAELLETYAELEQAAEADYKPYREVLQSVVRGFGERLGFRASEDEARSLPESVRNWQPFADTAAALRVLKRHHKLAVISNIDDDLFATSAPKLGVSFDYVITAQQAGCYKPCAKIFQMAQQRIGAEPRHWLHVGQSIYHDVIPAKALGIATVWVNRVSPRSGAGATIAAPGKPDVEVPDLRTLAGRASAKIEPPPC